MSDELAGINRGRSTDRVTVRTDRVSVLGAAMSEQGWRVECQDCPVTYGLEYGQTIKDGAEFPMTEQGRRDAEQWRNEHHQEHPDHAVKITHFIRWNMQVEHVHPDIWRLLTGER